MKHLFISFLLAGALISWAQTGGYADLVERVQGAVVHIETVGETVSNPHGNFDFFNQFQQRAPRRAPRGSGSGFIISSDGYVVTNRHVVADSTKVKVVLTDSKSYEAELVGIDDSLDIALLKIDGQNLPHVKIGNSDKMRIGDELLAMGYPLSLGFTVTRGILSGIGRNMNMGNLDLGTYLQTDADITFGNSGGPLLNTKGEVIGINTMILSEGETYGFAIPSNLFTHSIDELKEHGRVRRGALGIGVSALSEEALEYYGLERGALVTAVYDDFPAKKAGVQRDDVILEINGKAVKDNLDVVSTIANMRPGEEVKLHLLSRGKETTKTVVLADRNNFSSDTPQAEKEAEPEEVNLGLSMAPLDRSMRSQLGLDRDNGGMVVMDVKAGSLAEESGLAPGSVITQINHQPVRSIDDVRKALKGVEKNAPVPLSVLDRGRRGYSETERTVFLRKM